jgi:cold shock CspA family protein
MAKSTETSSKKEREKKKIQKRNEKEQERQQRKLNSKKSQGFDSMIGYVDEYGRLTDKPPEGIKKAIVNIEDIQLGAAARIEEKPEDIIRTGVVTFFNDSKGFGFIQDSVSNQSVFVHIHAATYQIRENDRVTFEIVSGQKGPAAANVKKA